MANEKTRYFCKRDECYTPMPPELEGTYYIGHPMWWKDGSQSPVAPMPECHKCGKSDMVGVCGYTRGNVSFHMN